MGSAFEGVREECTFPSLNQNMEGWPASILTSKHTGMVSLGFEIDEGRGTFLEVSLCVSKNY